MHRLIAVLFFLLTTLGYIPAYAQQTEKTNSKQTADTDRLKLYPNPAKTYVNIYVDWKTAQTFSIIIFDMQYNTPVSYTHLDVYKRQLYCTISTTQEPVL